MIGPYAVMRASCQPATGVHSTVSMWSVKLTPNPGFARTWASRSSAAGSGRRCTEMSSALMSCTVLGSARGARCDRVADLGRAPRSGVAGATIREVTEHGLLDLAGGHLQPEVVEHQADGQDRCRGVGLLLTGDVRGGAVHRLEHARCG